jgi:hypothetical protein
MKLALATNALCWWTESHASFHHRAYTIVSGLLYLQNDNWRPPHISYWGYPRWRWRRGFAFPINLGLGPIQDVVIPFNWKNTMAYEKDTINDTMNRGLEMQHYRGSPSTIRPRLGYFDQGAILKKAKAG